MSLAASRAKDAADSRCIPTFPALSSWHAACCQILCDRRESCPGSSRCHDPFDDFVRDYPGPPQPHACASLGGQSVLGPLADQPALKLREGREDIGHRLTSRRRRVDAQIKRHQSPAFLGRPLHETCEVEHGPGQSIELGNHQRVRTPILSVSESRQRCPDD